MTREQFIHQVMVQAATTQGLDLNYAYTRALDAWAIMHPSSVSKPTHTAAHEQIITAILRRNPIVTEDGRARDMLLRSIRRHYGRAPATARLESALNALEKRGAIRRTPSTIELA